MLSLSPATRIFRERHRAIIPRQQMVQWVEKIAFLLLAIYQGIWEELLTTGYLQVDETPVKVLDPEVKGKAVRRQKAPALWRAMKRRALELRANPRLLPQSSLGKAVNYFLNEYTAVVGYLGDGRFEIDNNLGFVQK